MEERKNIVGEYVICRKLISCFDHGIWLLDQAQETFSIVEMKKINNKDSTQSYNNNKAN